MELCLCGKINNTPHQLGRREQQPDQLGSWTDDVGCFALTDLLGEFGV